MSHVNIFERIDWYSNYLCFWMKIWKYEEIILWLEAKCCEMFWSSIGILGSFQSTMTVFHQTDDLVWGNSTRQLRQSSPSIVPSWRSAVLPWCGDCTHSLDCGGCGQSDEYKTVISSFRVFCVSVHLFVLTFRLFSSLLFSLLTSSTVGRSICQIWVEIEKHTKMTSLLNFEGCDPSGQVLSVCQFSHLGQSGERANNWTVHIGSLAISYRILSYLIVAYPILS
jgi:hypothetical protein